MAYIDADEYVDRAGSAETIRITDEAKTGSVDTQKLADALDDAADYINSMLVERYVTPIDDAPRLIVSYNYALAREILHKTKPTPEVTAAADRARAHLKLIADGKAGLSIPESGDPVAMTESGMAATSDDAATPVFSDTNLAGYNDINGGSSVAYWRR